MSCPIGLKLSRHFISKENKIGGFEIKTFLFGNEDRSNMPERESQKYLVQLICSMQYKVWYFDFRN